MFETLHQQQFQGEPDFFITEIAGADFLINFLQLFLLLFVQAPVQLPQRIPSETFDESIEVFELQRFVMKQRRFIE